MNYFELFELPTQFDINPDELETHYHRLQKLYHPDRFAMHSKLEQAAAARQSAASHDAVCTLRALYHVLNICWSSPVLISNQSKILFALLNF